MLLSPPDFYLLLLFISKHYTNNFPSGKRPLLHLVYLEEALFVNSNGLPYIFQHE